MIDSNREKRKLKKDPLNLTNQNFFQILAYKMTSYLLLH